MPRSVLRHHFQRGPANWREGHIVEVDESHLRTRKYHTGRLTFGQREQIWVVGGIDRTTKKAFVVHAEKRDAETLLPILRQYIRPGTTVITDGWSAYRRLSEGGELQHRVVNHSLNFVSPEDPTVYTQTVERMWRSLKAVYPEGGRPGENFFLYLSEFLYRQVRPKPVAELFPIKVGEGGGGRSRFWHPFFKQTNEWQRCQFAHAKRRNRN